MAIDLRSFLAKSL